MDKLIAFAVTLVIAAIIVGIFMVVGQHNAAHFYTPGVKLYGEGDYGGAKSDFESQVQESPNDDEALYYLGMCEVRTGDPVDGRMHLQLALANEEAKSHWQQRWVIKDATEALQALDTPQSQAPSSGQPVQNPN